MANFGKPGTKKPYIFGGINDGFGIICGKVFVPEILLKSEDTLIKFLHVDLAWNDPIISRTTALFMPEFP